MKSTRERLWLIPVVYSKLASWGFAKSRKSSAEGSPIPEVTKVILIHSFRCFFFVFFSLVSIPHISSFFLRKGGKKGGKQGCYLNFFRWMEPYVPKTLSLLVVFASRVRFEISYSSQLTEINRLVRIYNKSYLKFHGQISLCYDTN